MTFTSKQKRRHFWHQRPEFSLSPIPCTCNSKQEIPLSDNNAWTSRHYLRSCHALEASSMNSEFIIARRDAVEASMSKPLTLTELTKIEET